MRVVWRCDRTWELLCLSYWCIWELMCLFDRIMLLCHKKCSTKLFFFFFFCWKKKIITFIINQLYTIIYYMFLQSLFFFQMKNFYSTLLTQQLEICWNDLSPNFFSEFFFRIFFWEFVKKQFIQFFDVSRVE